MLFFSYYNELSPETQPPHGLFLTFFPRSSLKCQRTPDVGSPIAFIEEGKMITPAQAAAVLAERSQKGILPRPARKGFFRRYTEQARSAMEGAGLD